jgi:hypothetical protein
MREAPTANQNAEKLNKRTNNRRLLLITIACLITATTPTGGGVLLLTAKMAMRMIQAPADPKHIGEDRLLSHSTRSHRRRAMIVLSKNTKRGKKLNFKRMPRC